ncbi:MAG: glucose-1-phosphate adenylyltransferase [Armatimonadetes bacterium]|jgi:glucose-1-phosphate adenylyltransferase|nr:glucose-1-phosphate adenylyltransferase [Armatimonadota bacterium]MDI9583255.1 glucose-1-phosphate adenylyltransferase [Acidobacteriota bacterium]
MEHRLTGRDAPSNLLVMILAGGQGQRLYPLTRRRAKPAVRFGGNYRMIDFTLSNCVNSGMRRIFVMTQFAGWSLNRHIRRGWASMLSDELDEYVEVAPAQRMHGDRWYAGTADAIYQNIFLLQQERPDLVVILSGDHAYKMDYRRMVRQHLDAGAVLTIASLSLPREACTQLGVLEVDADWRIVGFEEKPDDPKPLPDDPAHSLVSMGVYVWETEALVRRVADDATRKTSHDFGKDIIPAMVQEGAAVYAHHFDTGPGGAKAYWRDIGTLDAYWAANMELVDVVPELNLYDREWPIYTDQVQAPPAKTVHAELCAVTDSMVCAGTIVSGATVHRSVISPNCYVHKGAQVVECVVMDGAEIGRGARLFRTIVDEDCRIPEGFAIGYDRQVDEKRFVVSEGGITVVPQGMILG